MTDWLAELRETTALDQSTLVQWRGIVDGLAGAGMPALSIFKGSTSNSHARCTVTVACQRDGTTGLP